MKTTSYKIFYLLFQLTFFTLLLGAVISVGEKIIGLASDGEEKYSIATYSTKKLKETPEIIAVKSKDVSINDSQFEYEEVGLNFKSSNTSVKLFMTFLHVVKVIYLVLILFMLRKFVRSLKTDQLFNIKNVNVLRQLGYLVLFGPLFRYIARFISESWINKHFVLDMLNDDNGQSVGYKVGFELGYTAAGGNSFLLFWMLTGLLILVISEVFRQGLIMKEEQDLTI